MELASIVLTCLVTVCAADRPKPIAGYYAQENHDSQQYQQSRHHSQFEHQEAHINYVQPEGNYNRPTGNYNRPTAVLAVSHDPAVPLDPPHTGHGYPVKPIPILKMVSDFNYKGNFNYNYETGNGITVHAVGSLKHLNGPKPKEIQVMHGSYSYTAPDGTPITTNWYADENGFHVEGSHLPKSQPVSKVIASPIIY